jgi:hypothetical protein
VQDSPETPDSVPEELARFLYQEVKSIHLLEGLLILMRTPDVGSTAEELARELRFNAQAIQGELARLAKIGVLVEAPGERGPTYRYAPRQERLRLIVEMLPGFYRSHPTRIIELIYSDGMEEKLRTFADAFRLTLEKARKPR